MIHFRRRNFLSSELKFLIKENYATLCYIHHNKDIQKNRFPQFFLHTICKNAYNLYGLYS